ncbi:MAG: M20/M25/M40 family metallo-hydrolase [Pleurocapsa minor GSE-CHR-MK-17-07R]|nr:M20/M25/M40 family metallo-hydrolase [Pleurocapsa minor GSE-CHR-MK 17-07R]
MSFDLKAHLRALSECHAPSGHEGPARDLVREAWTGLVDEFSVDGLGSLIGRRKATRTGAAAPRTIMLAAHMDEIGLMVTGFKNGFITFKSLAGMDNRLMLAQPVLVHGRERLPGLVASKPPHLLTTAARAKYPPFDELLIDVGLPAERVTELVQIGDIITIDAKLVELNNHKVSGKALDDRACVAAVTACLHHLQHMSHAWDVAAVATVQEESGLKGATTSAWLLQPDIAIALDVTFAPQPGVDADSSYEMGGGPGIGIGPNFHEGLYARIRETAKRHEIKLQDDIIPGASGTDGWAIQVSREGVPTALLEVPIRNMHAPVETADLRDIERLGRVLAHFIAELEPDFLTETVWTGESSK